MANPIGQPELCDLIVLAGTTSPGQAEIVGGGSPREWDKRKGYGLSGATLVYTGDGLAEFSVKISMWDETQLFQYEGDFALILAKPPTGKKPKALDFYHPLLSEPPIGIRAVVILDVSPLEQIADGMWTVTVKFQQYRAPKPALAKPSGSNSNAKVKRPDAADLMITDLTKQMRELL
jgi:hypothetical protein